ncbi:MAG: SBBP repeat-containing protein [Verrucomicrobia bacterium]|nr:SBBP repeat-containing protein [Verrucomicrobiota bacterium]
MRAGSQIVSACAFLLLMLLVPARNKAAEPPPDFLWVKTFGPNADSSGEGITVDADGNVYVVGSFTNTVTLGNIALGSNGAHDVFVAKYDVSGSAVWAKSGGGTGEDFGRGIAVDGAGNVFVTGQFDGWAGTLAYFDNAQIGANGRRDVFVVKFDRQGKVLWAKNAGGTPPFEEGGHSVAVDGQGNVYVAGQLTPSARFDELDVPNLGFEDLFLAKYSGAGRILWAKNAGDRYQDEGRSVAVDTSGNAWLFGTIAATNAFGSTSPWQLDAFLAKYDASGKLLWSRQSGGSGSDAGRAITIDPEGNAYATGEFSGTVNFGPSTLASQGGSDLFVAKYDSSGGVVWANQLGGRSDDFSFGIARDANGNIYVCGNISNQLSVAKSDKDGTLLWLQNAGGNGDSAAHGVAVDRTGQIYLTGYFSGEATFGPVALKAPQRKDTFIAKLASGAAPPLPIITLQPASRTNLVGTRADFFVFAAGTQPLAFQWQLNGSNLADATNAILSLTNIATKDAGDYRVLVSNASGSVVSSNATLTVRVPETAPDFLWARVFGGTNYDVGSDVASDKEGNVYFTGWATRPDVFRDEAPASGTSAGTFYVAKADPNGRVLWGHQLAGRPSGSLSQIISSGQAVAVDGLGIVSATGVFYDSIELGDATLTSRGSSDIFVVRYNRDGKVLWRQQIGGSLSETAADIAADSAGNVYVTGGFNAPAKIGEIQLSAESGAGIFLAKLNQEGKVQWVQEGLGFVTRPSLGVDRLGNIWLVAEGLSRLKIAFGATIMVSSAAILIMTRM